MKYIDNERLKNIEKNIFNRGRDIDVCLYNALFYPEYSEMVLDCLSAYMCRDGGFASGLHIDNYDTNSSVYQTYEALRMIDMSQLDKNTENPLFEETINRIGNYLFNKCKLNNNKWNPFNETTKDFAHSELYSNTEENKALFGYHPTLAILGYLLKYVNPTKAYYKKAIKLANLVIADLLEKEEFTKYEFISINSFINSVKDLNIFTNLEELTTKTIGLAKKQVTTTYDNVDAILPLDVCLFINNDEELNKLKEEQLDFLIESIAPHGLWEYNKEWGNNIYPEESSAQLKWLGAITVNNLYILKINNRIK